MPVPGAREVTGRAPSAPIEQALPPPSLPKHGSSYPEPQMPRSKRESRVSDMTMTSFPVSIRAKQKLAQSLSLPCLHLEADVALFSHGDGLVMITVR